MAVMKKRRRATTIIEIVMAMVILAVAMPPLMNAFVEASHQSIHPSKATIAAFLATERMEQIIARRYRNSEGYAAVSTANFPNESSVSGFVGFSRSVSITPVDALFSPVGTDEGYKLVRVTVSWSGGTESVRVERVFSDF